MSKEETDKIMGYFNATNIIKDDPKLKKKKSKSAKSVDLPEFKTKTMVKIKVCDDKRTKICKYKLKLSSKVKYLKNRIEKSGF